MAVLGYGIACLGADIRCLRPYQQLVKSTMETIFAVSCDPASFARDARILIEGDYRLLRATPVDQFAFTAHVETVAVFRRD